MKTLLRFFSYLFHGLLALFLMAISGLSMGSDSGTLHLGMLPWTGSTLANVVFFSALAGLIVTLLAIRGVLRPLFFLWALAVLVMMVKGYVFTGYHFSPGEGRTAGYLMVGALLALLGAWFRMMSPISRKARY